MQIGQVLPRMPADQAWGEGGGGGMRLLMKMEGVVGIAFSIHSLIMDGSSNKNKNDKRREKEDEV